MTGNLGGYQTVVTVFKALGGPKKASAILLGGAALIGLVIRDVTPRVARKVSPAVAKIVARVTKNAKSSPLRGRVFSVHTQGVDKSGLSFEVGDRFRVVEQDEDAVIIEVLGRDDDPQVADESFLGAISSFPDGGESDEPELTS